MTELFYLGPKGSYSHLAAKKVNASFEQQKNIQEVMTIGDVFAQVIHTNNIGIIPLENTTSGDVYDTYKFLYAHQVRIIQDIVIPIRHALIVQKGAVLSDIHSVYSHPQALMQVSSFTTEIGAQTFATNSTSEACMVVLQKNDKHIAAVAQKEAISQVEQLEALDINIANHQENYTRFLVIQDGVQETYQGNALFILFSLKEDEPGGLSKILALFAAYHINLRSIKSRPIEGAKFQYYFIIEASCEHVDEAMHKNIKNKLANKTERLAYSVYKEASRT